MRPTHRASATSRRSTIVPAVVLMAAGTLAAFGPSLVINAMDASIARVRQGQTARWIAAHIPPKLARTGDGVAAGAIAPGRDGYLLEIPRIGVQLVVHMLEPAVLQGINTPTLVRYGVGQVPFTTMLRNISPGQDGTAVIAGHRTTHGAPFRHLDLLRPGDVILLRRGAEVQHWRVEASAVVSPADLDAIRSHPGVRRLVLLACTPPFSARSRLMIDARLFRRGAENAHMRTGR